MEAADATKVPAGGALAVDRVKFSEYITEKIKGDPNIEIVEAEADRVSDGEISVIATGPLTSDKMSEYIKNDLGFEGLHFYDAAAPIVDFESINMDVAFKASRYGKGDADYINCPMNKEQYDAFYNELINAREAELHDFDRESQKKLTVFEGCMPVEVMARRGYDTLRYGPLKPVGLEHPTTGESYYAVVQLRKENNEGSMYNIVGFQTHLAFPEQRRVFSMIPGLAHAQFSRYGVMHRNTFLDSPRLLNAGFQMVAHPHLFFAGQMTGVEGYMESAASGMLAGINAVRFMQGKPLWQPPIETMLGALSRHVSNTATADFQPMGANFGILPPLDVEIRDKRQRYAALAERALAALEQEEIE